MTTDPATDVTYDQFELAVLQAHLDMYRALPECTSLTCFSLIHRDDHEKACQRLEERGMMKLTFYAGETIHEYAYEGSPLFDELKREGHQPFRFRGKLQIKYIKDVRPPGTNGKLTDKAPDEMARLFKAGILKKND